MRIARDRTATKTYNFGLAYANQTLTVSFAVSVPNDWETSDDFNVLANGSTVQTYHYGDSYHTESFSATADGSGNLILAFNLDTSQDSEVAYVDYVTINGPDATPPTVTDDTFSIDEDAGNGDTVGTVSTTDGTPTSLTILSGNGDGIFQIDNAGLITIADNTNLDYETTSSYTLSVQATNAYGNDTGTITVNINDIVVENLSCPGEVLGTLDGTSTTASQVVTGTVPGDSLVYYYFTPSAGGTVQVDSTMGSSASYNSLFIKNGCGGNLWSDESNGVSKSSPEVSVNANQTIVIAYERRFSSDRTFTLDITYTVPVATATDDSFSTLPNTELNENVLTNDFGPGIIVTGYTSPTHGSLTIAAANGSFTYTPDSNYTGTDSFEYNITDTSANTDSAIVTISVSAETTFNGSERAFTVRNPDETRNVAGDITVIGNSNQCVTTSTSSFDADCTTNVNTTANNNMTKYLNEDTSTSGIFNATDATLALATDRKVVWAGLYWQGFLHKCNNDNDSTCRFRDDGTTVDNDSLNLSSTSYDSNKVLFKTSATGNYQNIQAQQLDYLYNSAADGTIYSAYADVTSLLDANASQTYTVANIQSMEGKRGYGNYAAWALFVIYEYSGTDDPLDHEKSRNTSVFDGFEIVKGAGTNERVTIPVSGFRTPKTGAVDSKLISFAGEGENAYSPDFIRVNGTNVSNTDNPSNNVYNSSISGFTRTPSHANANGIDIDIFDISTLIPNDTTSATITIGSDTDHFYQSVLAFSTELYVPEFCYDYTMDVSGYVINSIDNQIQTALGGFGAPLSSHLYLRSLEGDLNLTNVSISYDINDTSQITYSPDSTEISEFDRYSYIDATSQTYNETDSGFIMSIGTGAGGQGVGGVIAAEQERYIKLDSDFAMSTVDTDFEFKVYYSIDYGSGDVNYQKTFETDDICTVSGSGGYYPTYGEFNVVDDDADYNTYNLHTQVSGRPFSMNVFAYDASDFTQETANTDLNMSVEVEFIRVDHFSRDAVVACGDEHARLSGLASKFVQIDGQNGGAVTYSASETNLAYRSLAMRVWYLVDPSSGALIDDHSCTSTNQAACESLYARGDFAGDTECTAECTVGGSGCYECLREYYSRKSCSRDNFAIRPEAFITQIIDSDQSTNIADPTLVIADSGAGATTANVVAGYAYRFDTDATNHLNNSPTTFYVQQFNNAGGTATAQMVPIPAFKNDPDCNDVDDKNISIVMFNGTTINSSSGQALTDTVEQIGEYQFKLYDEEWTRADRDASIMEHHTDPANSAHFTAGEDCVTGSSAVLSTASSGKHGCDISSVHTNVDTGTGYADLNMTYYPFEFDVSGLSFGLGPQQNLAIGIDDFLYMNTPGGNDENMSFNISGTFQARSHPTAANTEVSNFVAGCYSRDTDMTLLGTGMDLRFDLIDYNTSDPAVIILPREQGNTPLNAAIVQGEGNYAQDMRGAITMDLGYNFERNITTPLNPRRIQISDFNITLSANPVINVDLSNTHRIRGERNVDSNITFYYGRLHAPRHRIDGNAGNVTLYYEAYCDTNPAAGSVNAGNQCILASHPTTMGNSILSVDDIRWYQNEDHNQSEGNTTVMVQRNNAFNEVAETDLGFGGTRLQTWQVVYDDTTQGYPFKTTMEMTTQNWLRYHRFDPNALNSFELEFSSAGGWAGENTGSIAVDSNASATTNRRIEW